jgi:hypothetical protein
MLVLASAAGQSHSAVATFHVQGTIDDGFEAISPHVEVSFLGEGISRTVTADNKGSYETDLRLGT